MERLTIDVDKFRNEAQDYYDRLGSWQEATGCSHGDAARRLIVGLRAEVTLLRDENTKLLSLMLDSSRPAVEALLAENKTLRQHVDAVHGALADAGNIVVDYDRLGEGVRQLIAERDKLHNEREVSRLKPLAESPHSEAALRLLGEPVSNPMGRGRYYPAKHTRAVVEGLLAERDSDQEHEDEAWLKVNELRAEVERLRARLNGTTFVIEPSRPASFEMGME